jgi:hypothetical protein
MVPFTVNLQPPKDISRGTGTVTATGDPGKGFGVVS